MNRFSRLRELAARTTASVKELGILTKNEAAYDQDGHFQGIENHYNGPGIAEAAGGAALVGAGLGAGHVGVMKKYGTETVNREKGRFISPKQVKVPVGQAYKKAGNDVLGKIRAAAGKRFSAQDRLKELADSSNLFRNLPDDWERTGKITYSNPGDDRGTKTHYKKPVRIAAAEAFRTKFFPGRPENIGNIQEESLDHSPSRVRRAKAVATAAAAGAAGYLIGKHGLPKIGKRFSSDARIKELARGDFYLKYAKNWAKKQKPDVQSTIKQGLKFPGVKEILSRDPEALAEKMGIPVGSAHEIVQSSRAAQASRFRHEKAGGLYGATGLDMHQVMRHQVGPAMAEHMKDVDVAGELKSRRKLIKKNDFSSRLRLKELAEKSVSLKSFDQKVDENGHPILDGAVGAGLGAGAVLGHQAVMSNYGNFVDKNRVAGAYGRAADDFTSGVRSGFSAGNPGMINPPSTGEGSAMVAEAATNSPLSHDGAKFSGTAPSVDAAPGVGGTAKVVEDSGEALAALKKTSPLATAGEAVGGLGAKIRGLLSAVATRA